MKIAIASGKGGTGKTTLSTNLASYLAYENDVVLTDLDVEEPNSGLFIKGKTIHKEDKFKMMAKVRKAKADKNKETIKNNGNGEHQEHDHKEANN